MDKNAETKRILTYLGITFGLTYLLELTAVRYFVSHAQDLAATLSAQGLDAATASAAAQQISALAIGAMMFIPALAVLLTRLITREGFKNAWLRPNIKGHWRYYLLAWLAPLAVTLAGAAVYFLVFPEKFDWNLGFMVADYQAKGMSITAQSLRATLLWQLPLALVSAPVLNALNCFGEEWGWRGYLLPKLMEKMRLGPMLLVSGVIWGLWHAPLTIMGHNYGTSYGGYPYLGIAAMCCFCTALGVLFSYAAWHTKSVWPAVIGHGMINGVAAIAVYFTADGGSPLIGPAPTGILGGSALIAAAVLLFILWNREAKQEVKKEEPEIEAELP